MIWHSFKPTGDTHPRWGMVSGFYISSTTMNNQYQSRNRQNTQNGRNNQGQQQNGRSNGYGQQGGGRQQGNNREEKSYFNHHVNAVGYLNGISERSGQNGTFMF